MYKPIQIEFGSDEDRLARDPDGRYRLTQQPLPFLVPKGSFLTKLALTITEFPESDEVCIYLTYLAPPR